ncbi:MAG: carbohydrate-binding domain-containing protein [Bacteroidaceae bacterium]|nr:carbohydrate-binding domain-containing protein [Bacteroidaceae bacterium]
MKRDFLCVMLLAALLCGCDKSSDQQFPQGPGDFDPNFNPGQGGGGMGQAGSFDDSAIGELATFTITPYANAQTESETVTAGDEDFVENKQFAAVINIQYNADGNAVATGAPDGVVAIDGNRVTANAAASYKFVLSGKSANARFKLYSEKASAIVLDGVEIANPTGAAINVQSKKRTYLVLADGTTNTLTDGSNYETETVDGTAEKQKGTYYSKGQTIISGKGALAINANYKHGIDTKDYLRIRPNTFININAVEGNCIKCEDDDPESSGLLIDGGTLNLKTTATAGKCLSADGKVTINGGYVCAITTGGGEWDGDDAEVKDVSGAAGVKCDGVFTMNNGELLAYSSGKGGKGINGDTLLVFNGGKVRALTTGGVFSYTYGGATYETSPKGIKTDRTIEINGGDIMVRTLGAQEGSEGVEAKERIDIRGGMLQVYAADDALNAGYSRESLQEKQQMGIDVTGLKADAGEIIISGGEIYAYSTSNDAIDANGTITISGGKCVAVGAGVPEGGFDCDQNTFKVTGGILIGIGGTHSTPTESATSQPCVITSGLTFTAGQNYILKGDSEILSYKAVRTFSGASLLISSPSLKKGGSYTFGDASITCSSDTWVTGSGSNGMGPGGMQPGGGPGGTPPDGQGGQGGPGGTPPDGQGGGQNRF